MQDAYIIQGGKPLTGEVQLSGAKNVALKAIIASLLFDNKVTLTNVPRIKDVSVLLELIDSLGAGVSQDGNTVTVDPRSLQKHEVEMLFAAKTRVSFMLFAPLLLRLGKAHIPNPGGCRLGARPIDRQIEMMQSFGVSVEYDSATGYYNAMLDTKLPKAAKHRFDKPTHTGTELALMFACFADGESVIENAAAEPEIDDLMLFLTNAGAKIKREGKNIIISGVASLSQQSSFAISADRNEAPTYAIFGLATQGDITVIGIKDGSIKTFIEKVQEVGGGVEEVEKGIRFFYKGELRSCDIVTKPHPGFMTDWQGPWAVLMTQAIGKSTIHETIFENRFGYVSELKKLGAKIEYFEPNVDHPEEVYQFNYNDRESGCAPQAIHIYGKSKLHGGVLNVSDLRAGASLLIAASVAEGETIVNGASVIDRGYEQIDEKLKKLGCTIKKV